MYKATAFTAAATIIAAIAAVAAAAVASVALGASSEAAQASNASAETANRIATDAIDQQRREHLLRYADLVSFSTSTDDNEDRLLTITNLGYQRITRPVLQVEGSKVVIPLKNVPSCHSATYFIEHGWYTSGGRVRLTFQDADGEWWSRAESQPVKDSDESPRAVGRPVDKNGREILLRNVKGAKKDAPLATEVPVDRPTFELNHREKRVEGSNRWYVIVPYKGGRLGGVCPN